jgi:ParB/RepB/Spo0J family partition protein
MNPIAINQISANYTNNVRFENNYGDVNELANNIKQKGLIQPLIVEPSGDGYIIISGHRRYAAMKMLIERGDWDNDVLINCIVQHYDSELDRAAGKLLTNDSQPLSPDEWAAEIGRLAELGNDVRVIAYALGKSEQYVSNMKNTWSAMNENARKVIREGQVSMSLAAIMAKGSVNDTMASLSVQIAAAAKKTIKEQGSSASDAIIGEAVLMTTKEALDKATQNKSMSGFEIAESILENVDKVKEANKAAKSARKAAISVTTSKAPQRTLESFIQALVKHMRETGDDDTAELINTVVKHYKLGTESMDEVMEALYESI